jgi:hypothetical protein
MAVHLVLLLLLASPREMPWRLMLLVIQEMKWMLQLQLALTTQG